MTDWDDRSRRARTPARSRAPLSRPRRFSPGAVGAAAVVALAVVAYVAPRLLAPGDPLAIDPLDAFQAPSLEHLFGTDESGRDVLTRVVHGASASLTIGVSATAIGVGLALVLGLLAGLGTRAVDFATTRFLEVLFAFPGLLLALLVIVVAGPGVVTSTIAVGLSTAPGYARIIRSQVLVVRRSPYLEAALVLGRGRAYRLLRHLLPNVAGSLFALATLGVGQSIVWASSLSYLGLGAVPPAAEWGAMLSAGRTYLATAWWLTFFPGLAIVAIAAATTVLGRAMQARQRSA